jgi:hypothetical protein
LFGVRTTTIVGAAALSLYAIDFAAPRADKHDWPMLKAATDGLRGLGMTSPAPAPLLVCEGGKTSMRKKIATAPKGLITATLAPGENGTVMSPAIPLD